MSVEAREHGSVLGWVFGPLTKDRWDDFHDRAVREAAKEDLNSWDIEIGWTPNPDRPYTYFVYWWGRKFVASE